MAAIGEEILKNIVNKGEKNIFIIYGEDDFIKKQYVEKIAAKVTEKDDIFNYQKFTNEAELQEVYDAVMQLPMMSDKKCVILCDYDFEKAAKADFEKLCGLFSEVPETCVFIVWFDTFKFDFKKNLKLKEMTAACEKAGGTVANLSHKSVAELDKMLCSGALKRGCKMSSVAARKLIEIAGEDINILRNELEKLCIFAKGSDITAEMVEQIAIKTVEAEIFKLSNHIFAGDVVSSMKVLEELFFERVEPIVILSTVSSAFVDVYRAYAGKSAGLNIYQVAEEFSYGNKTFNLERAEINLRKLDFKRICLCLEALKEADKLLKSFSLDARTVLEQLVVRLIYIIAKGEEIDKS